MKTIQSQFPLCVKTITNSLDRLVAIKWISTRRLHHYLYIH
ncbi:MAG: hypothetical protein ACI8RD_002103 [Bacillariaceae sp.]|jgi:hypothetical protein